MNLIFPKNYSCNDCGCEIFDEIKGLCPDCLKNLPYIEGNVCMHCGQPMQSDGYYCKSCKGKKFVVDRAVAPFVYDGVIKKLTHDLKYFGKTYLAESLAIFMVECFNQTNLPFDEITCVPLCAKRLKQRGYNQAKVLADEFAKAYNKTTLDDILIRVKETPTQTELSANARVENMSGAFKAQNKKKIKDKIILLIDDIYTTGATTNECARALKSAGAKAVYVVTIAHTILKDKKKNTKSHKGF